MTTSLTAARPAASRRRSARRIGPALLALSIALLPAAARATCWCVFPPDQFLQWSGQVNLVVRDGGTIRLIPNIRITGTADDFALIVPTPALPALAPVDQAIWTDAADLTKPAVRRSLDSGDCGTAVQSADKSGDPLPLDTVIVHSQETVGAFEATIVSSTDPAALVTWLNDNGYLPDATQVAAFTPLVQAGWFFTAMKLLPGTPVPGNGWDTSVDPVEFTYAADEFDIPLHVLAINVAPALSITVYAVDDHRMDLPGFQASYSNRLSAGEMNAISAAHPTLAPYLGSGRTLTRLSRSFDASELAGTLRLERADTDDEFRTIVGARTVSGDFLLFGTLIAGLAWRSARGRRRVPVRAAA